MIAALILGALLLVSAAANFQQFTQMLAFSAVGGGARHSRQQLTEVALENNQSKNNIAIVDITGIITGDLLRRGASMVTLIRDQLHLAGNNRAVKAVVLKVDSPGGEVLASDEIAKSISEFQEEFGKPVVASMGGVAASGGYYVSAPCRWIVANELTITGSIGVIMHNYNYRGLMDKVGVRPQVFKSGRFKDMLSGDKAEVEILPEERQMIQSLIDETFRRFKQVVAAGRAYASRMNGGSGRTLVEGWEEFADGRVLSGRQAYDQGFVDELGDFRVAVDRALRLAKIEDANLIQYQRPFDLGNLFRLFGNSEDQAIRIDFGIPLPQLQVGRLYFLSPTIIQ